MEGEFDLPFCRFILLHELIYFHTLPLFPFCFKKILYFVIYMVGWKLHRMHTIVYKIGKIEKLFCIPITFNYHITKSIAYKFW